MEEERVREQLAEWLHSWVIKDRKNQMPWLEEMPWYTLEPDTQERWREKADEILAIKLGNRTLKEWIELYDKGKLRIEADDQSLPHIELFRGKASMSKIASMLGKGQEICEQLRKGGFVKVLKKE